MRLPRDVEVHVFFNEAGNVIESSSTRATSRSGEVLRDQIHRELVNPPFQFNKRSQLFLGTHHGALCVAMRVSNPDRSPFGINR